MKALVYTRPGELELIAVEEPRPAPGEVLVEVAAVGICGSELEGVASRSPFRVPPLVMRRDFAGRRLDTGEPVIVNPAAGTHRTGRGELMSVRDTLCPEHSSVRGVAGVWGVCGT